jgi:hypothetical protein
VEKIPFIHSSRGVYYHHHLYYLSKLIKEGKPPRTTQTLFCLQKKKNLALSHPKPTQPLLDVCPVYRKNVMPPLHPEQRPHPASTVSADKTSSTVEKALHIHRIGCAERPLFLLAWFLSNIGSASIQCLSSRSVSV